MLLILPNWEPKDVAMVSTCPYLNTRLSSEDFVVGVYYL